MRLAWRCIISSLVRFQVFNCNSQSKKQLNEANTSIYIFQKIRDDYFRRHLLRLSLSFHKQRSMKNINRPCRLLTRRETWCKWRWRRRKRHEQPCRGRWSVAHFHHRFHRYFHPQPTWVGEIRITPNPLGWGKYVSSPAHLGGGNTYHDT